MADTPNPYSLDGLGFEMDRVGRPGEAAEWFQKALQGEPAWMPVAAALAKKAGDEDEYQRIRALATGDHGGFDAFVNELLEEAGY